MNDPKFMKIFNARDNLLKILACLFFFESRVFDNVIKEFAPTSIFHNKIEFLWCFDNFIHLNDIRMSDHL